MEDVNCVLSPNKKYLVGAIVCMTSVLKNADIKAKVRFFILHTELDKEDIKTINRLKKIRECEIHIINVKEYLGYFKNVDFLEHRNTLHNQILLINQNLLLMLYYLKNI